MSDTFIAKARGFESNLPLEWFFIPNRIYLDEFGTKIGIISFIVFFFLTFFIVFFSIDKKTKIKQRLKLSLVGVAIYLLCALIYVAYQFIQQPISKIKIIDQNKAQIIYRVPYKKDEYIYKKDFTGLNYNKTHQIIREGQGSRQQTIRNCEITLSTLNHTEYKIPFNLCDELMFKSQRLKNEQKQKNKSN